MSKELTPLDMVNHKEIVTSAEEVEFDDVDANKTNEVE